MTKYLFYIFNFLFKLYLLKYDIIGQEKWNFVIIQYIIKFKIQLYCIRKHQIKAEIKRKMI